MNDRDNRRYERLTRIQTFGRARAADFTEGSPTRLRYGDLDKVIVAIDVAKADQLPARVSRATLVDALRLDLQSIAHTAHAIELQEPDFEAPYAMPANTAEEPTVTHADAVLALLEDAAADTPAAKTAKTALRAKFVGYEMSADFVTELRAAREAVTNATSHNQGETQDGVKSTAEIGRLLKDGSDIVTHLDAAMKNKYRRVPAVLAAWESASRLERAPGQGKPPTDGNGSGGTPVPPVA